MVTAIGSTTANTKRQLRNCSTTPDSVGPTAGAVAITKLIVPITRPRKCRGTNSITVVISSGIITAVPLAWTTRPSRSRGKVGETAASAVPTANSDMARVKTPRVDSRWINQPLIGITTAMVSMKPVVSHCAVRSVTAKSRMIRDRATFMAVSLRITTKAPVISTARTVLVVAGSRSVAVGPGATGGVGARADSSSLVALVEAEVMSSRICGAARWGRWGEATTLTPVSIVQPGSTLRYSRERPSDFGHGQGGRCGCGRLVPKPRDPRSGRRHSMEEGQR